jgi:hypothetical protein
MTADKGDGGLDSTGKATSLVWLVSDEGSGSKACDFAWRLGADRAPIKAIVSRCFFIIMAP